MRWSRSQSVLDGRSDDEGEAVFRDVSIGDGMREEWRDQDCLGPVCVRGR